MNGTSYVPGVLVVGEVDRNEFLASYTPQFTIYSCLHQHKEKLHFGEKIGKKRSIQKDNQIDNSVNQTNELTDSKTTQQQFNSFRVVSETCILIFRRHLMISRPRKRSE